MDPFTKLPTLQEVATKVWNIHHELRALAQGMGTKVAETDQSIQENNALTDAAIEEINLKLAFLMTMIAVKQPLNSGIADSTGKVHYASKPAMQVYLEGGRQKMIDQREAFLRAQNLQAANPSGPDESAATGSADGAEADSSPDAKVH